MPKLSEWHIYGSESHGRFSIRKPEKALKYINLAAENYALDDYPYFSYIPKFTRQLLFKQYELKDHLGNERSVISDLKTPKVLALDLEGTLVTTAVSMLPRPGLYEFLEYCKGRFERIVMMTSVPRDWFEKVRDVLLKNEEAPPWFIRVKYINYADREESNFGEFKDLRCIPNCNEHEAILIDDMEWFIRESQKDRWIEIKPFNGEEDDREFERIIEYFEWVFED